MKLLSEQLRSEYQRVALELVRLALQMATPFNFLVLWAVVSDMVVNFDSDVMGLFPIANSKHDVAGLVLTCWRNIR